MWVPNHLLPIPIPSLHPPRSLPHHREANMHCALKQLRQQQRRRRRRTRRKEVSRGAVVVTILLSIRMGSPVAPCRHTMDRALAAIAVYNFVGGSECVCLDALNPPTRHPAVAVVEAFVGLREASSRGIRPEIVFHCHSLGGWDLSSSHNVYFCQPRITLQLCKSVTRKRRMRRRKSH